MGRFLSFFSLAVLTGLLVSATGFARADADADGNGITVMLPGDVPLELVRIPAGSFVMGSPTDELDRLAHEGPQTNVTISEDFHMGMYPVTQAQWAAVMGERWPHLRVRDAPDNPVESVSWNDAKNFIEVLNAHIEESGQGPLTMRLPTEAEWEYACRAGTTTRFHFGDALPADDEAGGHAANDFEDVENAADSPPMADEDEDIFSRHLWYHGNNARPGSPRYGAKPVGEKPPNAFGLHDMHGNV